MHVCVGGCESGIEHMSEIFLRNMNWYVAKSKELFNGYPEGKIHTESILDM